ncbi:MAG: hypothetical protein JKX71_07475 [Amylibacter sp.]|nr:hypothetical protein [Amylibacter sp.]
MECVFDIQVLLSNASQIDPIFEHLISTTFNTTDQNLLQTASPDLQNNWIHKKTDTPVFDYLDHIGDFASQFINSNDWIKVDNEICADLIEKLLFNKHAEVKVGVQKLRRNAKHIIIGGIISCAVNQSLASARNQVQAAE